MPFFLVASHRLVYNNDDSRKEGVINYKTFVQRRRIAEEDIVVERYPLRTSLVRQKGSEITWQLLHRDHPVPVVVRT